MSPLIDSLVLLRRETGQSDRERGVRISHQVLVILRGLLYYRWRLLKCTYYTCRVALSSEATSLEVKLRRLVEETDE